MTKQQSLHWGASQLKIYIKNDMELIQSDITECMHGGLFLNGNADTIL